MSGLDTKAILEGRRPGRRSIGLFVGIFVSVLCTLAMLGYLLLAGLATGGVAGVAGFLIALVAAVVPVAVLVPLILMLDRLEPEPRSMMVFAFVWGAGVAVGASFLLNTAGMEMWAVPLFGADMGETVTTVGLAPVVEESAKGLVLLVLLWRRRYEIDSYTDGVTYAAMVATGFAFTENVLYFLTSYFEQGFFGLAFTFVLRGLVGPFGHPLYTAMIGLAVAHAAMSRDLFTRVTAPVGGWIGAVLLHAMWNGSTVFGWGMVGVAYGVLFIVLLVIIVVAVQDRRRQVGAISYYLPQYVSTGLVTPADVRMLSTIKGRRAARSWAQRNAGRRGRDAMKDYQLAATELALLHQRVDRGVARPEWEQRRDGFLALMHVAREAFLGRVARPAAPAWAPSPTDSGFLKRSDFSHVITQAQAKRGFSERPGQAPPGPPPGPPQGPFPPPPRS